MHSSYLYIECPLLNSFVFKGKPNLLFLSISHSLLCKCTQWAVNLLALHLLTSSPIHTAWKGQFSFPINISADLAPVAILLVYTLHPSGEIVADTVKFQVEKCFKNKVISFFLLLAGPEWERWALFSLPSHSYKLHKVVSINVAVIKLLGGNRIAKQNEYVLAAMPILRWWEDVPGGEARVIVGRKNIGTEIYKDVFGKKTHWEYSNSIHMRLSYSHPFLPLLQVSIQFSEEQGLPGSNTTLYLEAAPDSFCALRAVDKSILLLKSEQELSAESVSSLTSQFSPGPLQV